MCCWHFRRTEKYSSENYTIADGLSLAKHTRNCVRQRFAHSRGFRVLMDFLRNVIPRNMVVRVVDSAPKIKDIEFGTACDKCLQWAQATFDLNRTSGL